MIVFKYLFESKCIVHRRQLKSMNRIPCGCNGQCYYCLPPKERNRQLSEIIFRPIFPRLLCCKCFMCTFPRTPSCLEVSYFMKSISNPELLLTKITCDRKIAYDRKKAKKRIVILYLQCVGRFLRLLSRSNEKRYMPNGKGFLEAKLSFELCKEKI